MVPWRRARRGFERSRPPIPATAGLNRATDVKPAASYPYPISAGPGRAYMVLRCGPCATSTSSGGRVLDVHGGDVRSEFGERRCELFVEVLRQRAGEQVERVGVVERLM